MREAINLITLVGFFFLVLYHDRRQPQPYLKFVLIGLVAVGVTKGVLPLIKQDVIRYLLVSLTLLIGWISYVWLEKKQDINKNS